jgi:ABC-type branched-subunit amino acid transport system permease subunit
LKGSYFLLVTVAFAEVLRIVENSRFSAYLVAIRENEAAATSLGLSSLLVE